MLRYVLVCCLLVTSGCASSPDSELSSRADLAFVHVNVVDVETGTVRPDQTVLVEGERIELVAPSRRIAVPRAARVVDGSGKYLIPGLWDMGVHIFRHRKPPRTFAASWFPLFIANGVTSVRETFTNFDDVPLLRSFRAEVAAGSLVGPKIVHAGPLVESIPPGRTTPSHPGALVAQTEEQSRALVREVRNRQLDYLNIQAYVPRDIYFAIADESKKQGLPFAGRVPKTLTIMEASDAGQRSINMAGVLETCSIDGKSRAEWSDLAARDAYVYLRELLANQDPGGCRPLFERLAANRTWLDAHLVSWWAGDTGDSRWIRSSHLKYIPAAWRQEWEKAFAESRTHPELEVAWARQLARYVGNMHRIGVPVLSGTSVGNEFLVAGFSLHENLELLVSEAGLTPLEALRTATLNPARYIGLADAATIRQGNVADLVLLDANPVVDITNTQRVRAVVLNGRYLDRGALDALLRQAEEVAEASDGAVD